MDTGSPQVQPTNGKIPAQRPPVLHRHRQVARIANTHLPPLKPKLNLSSFLNLSSPPTCRSNFTRLQRRPLLDLNIPRLAYTPYPTFERLLAQTTARGIFRNWHDHINEFTNVARGVRKTSEVYSDNGCSGAWEACGEVFEGVEESA